MRNQAHHDHRNAPEKTSQTSSEEDAAQSDSNGCYNKPRPEPPLLFFNKFPIANKEVQVISRSARASDTNSESRENTAQTKTGNKKLLTASLYEK